LSKKKELSDNSFCHIIISPYSNLLNISTSQKTASKNAIPNISTSGFYNFDLPDYPTINSAYE